MSWYKGNMVPRLLDFVMGRKAIEKLRPEVMRHATGVVLEVGAGSGHNVPFYPHIEKLILLEPSSELLDIARKRVHGLAYPVEFSHVSAERIPLPDQSVDTVVSTWTLCSMDDPSSSLKEIARVLKREGRFVFIDHGASSNPIVRALQMLWNPFSVRFTGNCHLDRDIEKLITDAGFRIENKRQFHERAKPLMYNTQGVAAH